MMHTWVSFKLFSKLLVSLIYFTNYNEKNISTNNPRGVKSSRWSNKSHACIPLSTIIWHPSIDKSAFAGDVSSSITCQGTQGESHPPVCCVGDMETSVLAGDLQWPCEPAQAPLATVQESLENTVLDNYPQTRELLCKSRNPMEKFQHTIREKKYMHSETLKDWSVKCGGGDSYFQCEDSNTRLQRI